MESTVERLNDVLVDVPVVRWLSQKCSVQPWVVATVGTFGICSFVLWGFVGELLCTITAVLYPMYGSFKALEAEPEQVQLWLTYWVTYAALMLLESSFKAILSWLPFYTFFRIAMLLWLYLPATRGAQSVYRWVVAPVLRRYSPQIDAILAKSAEEVRGTLGSAKEIRQTLQQAAVDSAKYMGHNIGVEELIKQELTKTANARLSRGGELTPVGSRARVASPTARCPAAPMPRCTEMHSCSEDEDKENAF
jgi:receptor expression-enhancing protein 5/6